MKKIMGLLGLLLTYSGAGWAVCMPGGTCGPATQYGVTVLEVALCTDAACTTPVVVGSGARTFDIASVGVGAEAGAYANFNNLPVGVYTHMRSILSRTFIISGPSIVSLNGINCAVQNAAALSVPNGVDPVPLDAIAQAGQPAIDAGLSWNDAARTQLKMVGALTTPLNISQSGSRPTLKIAFGTQTALMCVDTAPLAAMNIPQPPEVLVTITP